MWMYKKLFEKRNKHKKVSQRINMSQVSGVTVALNNIITDLSAAVILTEKMKADDCDIQTFQRYKKIFHETWLGVAEHYNVINKIDMENLMNH